ncbi:MAG TPA: SAM-dependent methyltransferase [Methylophilaceae bacterium]|nr:SAM-dependent methyltransferase [Methylophilaceae bacterium]
MTLLPTPGLPEPTPEALSHSKQLTQLIHEKIDAVGGWISFADYMHMALYQPGLGYYSGGAKKFGAGGDFVTAPEISSLFAQSLATQAAQILGLTHGSILELGAGTGRLALELLLELQSLNQLPAQYLILEVSAQLHQQQQQTLQKYLPPELLERVVWLDALPEKFSGLILANEVLDALPVHIVKRQPAWLVEVGVGVNSHGFVWSEQVLASGQLYEAASVLDLPPDYTTEQCPQAGALIASLANMLELGAIVLIDYGFPRREYYHPQRSEGTLMCHYQHYAHGDPFLHPGLQDITAHVDFTSVAEAGLAEGLQLMGYCGQAQFLINCGITEILARVSPQDMASYAPLASQAQKLLSPAEMGELFKVIAFGKGLVDDLAGFSRGDRRHTL